MAVQILLAGDYLTMPAGQGRVKIRRGFNEDVPAEMGAWANAVLIIDERPVIIQLSFGNCVTVGQIRELNAAHIDAIEIDLSYVLRLEVITTNILREAIVDTAPRVWLNQTSALRAENVLTAHIQYASHQAQVRNAHTEPLSQGIFPELRDDGYIEHLAGMFGSQLASCVAAVTAGRGSQTWYNVQVQSVLIGILMCATEHDRDVVEVDTIVDGLKKRGFVKAKSDNFPPDARLPSGETVAQSQRAEVVRYVRYMQVAGLLNKHLKPTPMHGETCKRILRKYA